MPKVSLATLRNDVLAAAKDVARETNENECHDGLPPEGSMVLVTESDRVLWKAASRLLRWERTRKR